MSNVCVIIPMFGKEEYTKKCVELTLKNAGMPVDILVVDDGSLVPYVDERVKVLRLEKNSGYTNATNQGILWCGDKYKYVHTLNNDTEPTEKFIKVLYDIMEEDKTIGIASSVRKYDRPGEYNYELYGMDLIMGWQICTVDKPTESILDCNWVPICSALLRVEMLRYVGILDRRMINHCSDNDLCVRCKMDGWRVVVCGDSLVFHHHEVTTKESPLCNIHGDQKILLEKITGLKYKELMAVLPISVEDNTYGDLTFTVYKKEKK